MTKCTVWVNWEEKIFYNKNRQKAQTACHAITCDLSLTLSNAQQDADMIKESEPQAKTLLVSTRNPH